MGKALEPPLEQAAALPYRWHEGRLQFCLITTSQSKRWGFPKGIVDPGDTPPDTARKESFEEAGLHGNVDEPTLGHYLYSKWGRLLHVTAYTMHVTQADDQWAESDRRKRRWCTVQEAAKLLDRRELLQLLETAVARLNGHRRP